MDDKLGSLKRRLRIVYSDIIRGYCYSKNFDCFIKHFNDNDLGLLGEHEYFCRLEARESGLLTESEQITQLIENGTWSAGEEGELDSLASHIKSLQQSLEQHYGEEKENIGKTLSEKTKELEILEYKRKSMLGLTIEKFVDKKRSDHSIYLSFYKNRKCSEHFWNEEEFDDVDHEEMYSLVKEYNDATETITHENIQRIAAQPYFLNKFFIANGDPMVFFGKAAILLTQYQSELMGQGRMYKSILENNEGGASPPDSFYDDPDKLVKWYYAQTKGQASHSHHKSKIASAGGDSFAASSVPGADMDELKAMASARGEMPIDLNKQIQKMKESKGKDELDMMDMLQIHGEDTSCLPGGGS